MTSFVKGNTMKYHENPLSEFRIDFADVRTCIHTCAYNVWNENSIVLVEVANSLTLCIF